MKTISAVGVGFFVRRMGIWLALGMWLIQGMAYGMDAGATLKLGTPGVGFDLTLGVVERLNFRAGLNMLPVTFKMSGEYGNANVTTDLHLETIPITLDWHPYASNFRISAGMALNNSELTLEASRGDSYEFEDRDYVVESLTATIDVNDLSPYFGIGYGNAVRKGSRLTFAFDFGVLYHGSPRLRAEAVAARPEYQDALDRDLQREVDEAQDALDAYRFYPVLTFGLSYRF